MEETNLQSKLENLIRQFVSDIIEITITAPLDEVAALGQKVSASRAVHSKRRVSAKAEAYVRKYLEERGLTEMLSDTLIDYVKLDYPRFHDLAEYTGTPPVQTRKKFSRIRTILGVGSLPQLASLLTQVLFVGRHPHETEAIEAALQRNKAHRYDMSPVSEACLVEFLDQHGLAEKKRSLVLDYVKMGFPRLREFAKKMGAAEVQNRKKFSRIKNSLGVDNLGQLAKLLTLVLIEGDMQRDGT